MALGVVLLLSFFRSFFGSLWCLVSLFFFFLIHCCALTCSDGKKKSKVINRAFSNLLGTKKQS